MTCGMVLHTSKDGNLEDIKIDKAGNTLCTLKVPPNGHMVAELEEELLPTQELCTSLS